MNPARLVEVATSGAVVTRYGDTCRVAGQVDQHPAERLLGGQGLPDLTPVAVGDRQLEPLHGLPAAAPRARGQATSRPATLAGSNRSHSVCGVSRRLSRRAVTCSAVSSAAWLRGLPAVGSPHPLTV